jgi:flagellar FliL protein
MADQLGGLSKLVRKSWRWGVAAALVLLIAGATWHRFRHAASTVRHQAKAESEVVAVLHLEPFVVNLADPEGDRFLRVGIELGLDRELGQHDREGQSALAMAHTRDTILMILTTRKADDLLTSEGKAKLKDELTNALRERVPKLGVHDIYFTDFLVQR